MERAGFEYLEDAVTSDVTFRAFGADLDELFRVAGDATTAAMVRSLDSVVPRTSRRVALAADALDLLLMSFLDEIVFWKDAEQLLLRPADVRVLSSDGRYEVSAELRGEPIDSRRHELEADVKGVTLHGLRVERSGAGWSAQVTLDV
jgi:SHS2 domain-containing protein